MTDIDVRIMAHEKRVEYIPYLLTKLNLDESHVIWDQKENRWDTGRRAWNDIDRSAQWGCVIQDDALVCQDFVPGLSEALNYVDENVVVSPYVGTRRPLAQKVENAVQKARDDNASWIKMPGLNWGIAIVLPTWIIDDMIPWCDTRRYPNYDKRIGRYCIDKLKIPTLCTWPSLVDHRDTESLIGHGGGRFAHHFVGENFSALDIDWNGPTVDMGEQYRHKIITNRARSFRTA